MRNVLFLILLVCFLFSCDNEPAFHEVDESNVELGFVIPPDVAKLEALDFLNSKGAITRSVSDEEIDVTLSWRSLSVPYKDIRTRSQGSSNIDVPIYVFTLRDDNKPAGYVVSAGDKRVTNRILVFSDKGEWDLSEIPGFESVFWDNVDDYLVSTITNSVIDMCDNYYFSEYSSESEVFCSDFLLKWGQSASPYNDSVPACDYYSNVPAGCVAVAMGQIMGYHGHPLTGNYIHQQYNRTVSVRYDWMKIRSYLDAVHLTDPVGRNGVANLLAEAGYKVYMQYGCNGSGAYSVDVPQAFRKMGYSSSSLSSFNIRTVFDNIKKKRPVYVRGTSSRGGHAWVIEGYKTMNYDVYYGRDCPYGGGPSIPPHVIGNEYSYYLYFNLGWRGTSNGYYYSGVFRNYDDLDFFGEYIRYDSWEFSKSVSMIYDIIPVR